MTDRHFADIKVSRLRLREVGELASSALTDRSGLTMTFLNPDYARRALLDRSLKGDINAFDLVMVDGNGVRVFAPLFGFTVPERLDTNSVAPLIFELLSNVGGRVFLFGCAPGVAAAAGEQVSAAYPGLSVVGTDHGYYDVQRDHPGYFDVRDTAKIIDEVNDSCADCLIVSLPTPMQQSWVAANAHRLDAPIIMTAGSYLEHVAESDALTLHWYPRWADTLRLNWLYRLSRDPRRLWRRYSTEFAHFAFLSVKARVRLGRSRDR